MLNKVILNGRLTKDVEINDNNGNAYCKFSVAVGRDFAKDKTDFFNCVAFGNNALFLQKYVKKGATLGIVGRLQLNSYKKKDGTQTTSVDIVVENVYTLLKGEDSSHSTSEAKPAKANNKQQETDSNDKDEFFDIPEDDLPF